MQLFIGLGTQWRTGMAGPTGLDYAAIDPTARMMRIKLTPERFNGLRVMEGAALNVMGERRNKK